jgi:hypothetical protein
MKLFLLSYSFVFEMRLFNAAGARRFVSPVRSFASALQKTDPEVRFFFFFFFFFSFFF